MTFTSTSPRRRLTRSTLAALGLGALALGGLATPAHAGAPVDGGTFAFSETESFTDCGFTADVSAQLHGRVSIKDARPTTSGQFFYLIQSVWYHATVTNRATGAYVTEDWHTTSREQKAQVRSTYVDGDGVGHLVISWQVVESGPWDTWADASGSVFLRITGSHVQDYVGDFVVDDQPGGWTLVSVEDGRESGRWDMPDFCAMLSDHIG